MADEIQLAFVRPGAPEQVRAEWREDPPPALTRDRFDFELEDESYNSLTWVARYYDWPQKILLWTTFGFALLFRKFLLSQFRLTAHFAAEGPAETKITLSGQAHPRTREALSRLALENGGAVGLAIGV